MKKIRKVKKTIEIIEPLFKVDDVVMLKENLLMVVIGDISTKQNKYYYKVCYNHLNSGEDKKYAWFWVYEEELGTQPFNYEALLMGKYIEYKCKYERLCLELTSRFKR